MIASVHACVGAAIGRLVTNRPAAFVLGVVSHAICDRLPHRDFTPQVEAPLLAVTMTGLVARFGITSPEVIGAAGAVSPDLENAASRVGLIRADQMVFPTHQGAHSHGRETKTVLPQVALAAACLAIAFWPRKK